MNAEIAALADEYWQYRLKNGPTEAHYYGDYRYVAAFEDYSRASEDRDIAFYRSVAAQAEAIDPTALTSDENTTRESLMYYAGTAAAVSELRMAEFGVDPIFGLQASVHMLIPRLTVPDTEVAEAMLDKYRGLAAAFDQQADRLREGVAAGRVPARFAVDSTIGQLDTWLATDVSDDSLLKAALPDSMTDDEKASWRERAAAVVTETVRPALQRHRDLLTDQVAPVARADEQAGLWALGDGDLIYSRLIEKYTTLPLQAGEIHQIGLQKIAQLENEYRQYGPEALGTDDVNEIYSMLRTDEALLHTNGPDIIAVCEAAFERAREEMPNWFNVFPESDCGIEETQHGAIAFYFPPAEDGSRAGTFFMNTSDPTAWGKAEIEATAFHEGIPGHHMQIALAQEKGDALPGFRRNEYIAAFAEGWGLYTERLSHEMGLYSGTLDLIGMLQADSMRACRLVVDTGMHALGWSRQQGIDYMFENSPLSMHQIVGEIDRYLTTPGQALGYMMGRIEIDRIRRAAEASLGEAFDIKGFHDTVIGSGCVPLNTLDRLVDEWVAASS